MFPFIYREMRPNNHLRSYIKCYWRYRRSFAPRKSHTIFPDSNYELIWVQEGPLLRDGEIMPKLFLGGQSRQPIKISGAGRVELWSVRFFPWGFAPFGDVKIVASETYVPVEAMFDEQTVADLYALFESATRKTIVEMLDDYLLQKLLVSRFDASILRGASEHLLERQGNIKIKDLANYCSLSQRQLERNISRATGKTPQEIASRLRFEHVRNTMVLCPEIPLATLAQQHGYTDQSHLNKEFKRYTDMTPTKYAETFRATYAHIRPSDVALLQYPDEYTVPQYNKSLFNAPRRHDGKTKNANNTRRKPKE